MSFFIYSTVINTAKRYKLHTKLSRIGVHNFGWFNRAFRIKLHVLLLIYTLVQNTILISVSISRVQSGLCRHQRVVYWFRRWYMRSSIIQASLLFERICPARQFPPRTSPRRKRLISQICFPSEVRRLEWSLLRTDTLSTEWDVLFGAFECGLAFFPQLTQVCCHLERALGQL